MNLSTAPRNIPIRPGRPFRASDTQRATTPHGPNTEHSHTIPISQIASAYPHRASIFFGRQLLERSLTLQVSPSASAAPSSQAHFQPPQHLDSVASFDQSRPPPRHLPDRTKIDSPAPQRSTASRTPSAALFYHTHPSTPNHTRLLFHPPHRTGNSTHPQTFSPP